MRTQIDCLSCFVIVSKYKADVMVSEREMTTHHNRKGLVVSFINRGAEENVMNFSHKCQKNKISLRTGRTSADDRLAWYNGHFTRAIISSRFE